MWDLFLVLLLKPISRYCIEICLISEFIHPRRVIFNDAKRSYFKTSSRQGVLAIRLTQPFSPCVFS